MSNNPLVLYHTDGCHLCEQAQALAAEAGLEVDLKDIVDNPDWVERYGIRIPVVQRTDGTELGWPFDLAQLVAFAKEEQ